MGAEEMMGSEDRAAISEKVGDLAGTVCECVRSLPPGWDDPEYPDRLPPSGRAFVVGSDGEVVRNLTARQDCPHCGGDGRIRSDDYPGRCPCAVHLPAGWLLRPHPVGHAFPDPPSGRIYRVDPEEPGAPPRWSVDPSCLKCGGTGTDMPLDPLGVRMAEIFSSVHQHPGPAPGGSGLVPPGSTTDAVEDDSDILPVFEPPPCPDAGRPAHRGFGVQGSPVDQPIAILISATEAMRAVRNLSRQDAIRALHVAAQIIEDCGPAGPQ